MCKVTIFGKHGLVAHIPLMAKPIRALKLHYPMIQVLIINIIIIIISSFFCALNTWCYCAVWILFFSLLLSPSENCHASMCKIVP